MRTLLLSLLFAGFLLPATAQTQVLPPGERDWRFIAGGATVGWPVVDQRGRYYFTAEDRFLYALDIDGIMRWRTDLGRRSAGMIAVGPDQSLYVVLEDGRLLAINKDGRLIWEIELARGAQLAPIALSTGMVIASDATGRVVAVTHTGARIWEMVLGEAISCPPVVNYDGMLVFATQRGNLVTVEPSGRIARRRYIGDVPSVIAPYPGGLYIGTTSGKLLNIGAASEPLWRTDLGSAVAELVVGSEGDSYARLDDGSLAHVSTAGVATWRANPTPAVVLSLTAAHGVLMAISGGSLAHIKPDGTLSWQIRLPSTPLVASLSGGGSVTVSTGNWVTYSYPLDLQADGVWPAVRGTPAATGVPPGVTVSRPGISAFSDSLDYIYLSEFLRSPLENDQIAGLREIAGRIRPADGPEGTGIYGFAGSYPYILSLCEDVAGAPYFGPIGFSGQVTVGRTARTHALEILGAIGDLGTTRYLLRLLREEETSDLQVEILDALAKLGTSASGDAIRTLDQVIQSHIVEAGSDQVARAAVAFLGAIYEYEGGFLSADGVLLLTRIMSGPYDRITRDAAASALSALVARD